MNKRRKELINFLAMSIAYWIFGATFFVAGIFNAAYFPDLSGTFSLVCIGGFLFVCIGFVPFNKYNKLKEEVAKSWTFDKSSFFKVCQENNINDNSTNWDKAREYIVLLMDKDNVPNKYRSYYLSGDFLKACYIEEKTKYNDKCLEFYNKCLDKKITRDLLNENNLRLIAKNYGIDNPSDAKTMFLTGEKLSNELLRKAQEQEYEQKTLKETEKFETTKHSALTVSKQIYLHPILEKYEIIKKQYELIKGIENDAPEFAKSVRPNTHNSALWGGIANGLGGVGAGLVTAYQTEQENQLARQNAQHKTSSWMDVYRIAFNNVYPLKSAKEKLEKQIENINEAMIDDEDAFTKMKKVGLSVEEYTITDNGFMNITIYTEYNKSEISLFHNAAIVDGAVKIIILKNGKPVGEAYISNNYSYEEVSQCSEELGFNSFYSVLGKANEGKFDRSCEYSFEFEPIKIWYMEKFEKCDNIDFNKTDKAFNEVRYAVLKAPMI